VNLSEVEEGEDQMQIVGRFGERSEGDDV